MVEREINLSSVLVVIWERGKKIALFTFLCAVLGYVGTFLIPERFSSEATVFMNRSKIGERTMTDPPVSMQTYENFFSRQPMMKRVIEKYDLHKAPYNLKYPNDLKGRISVEREELISLLSVSVEMEDPEMAATVANELAAQAIDINQKVMQLEAESSTDKIEEAVLPIVEEMNANRQAYLQTLNKNTKQVLNSNFNSNISTLALFQQQKANLDVSIIELENRLAYFEDIFSATDFNETIEVKRKVIYDPLVTETIRDKVRDMNVDELNDFSLREEHLNSAYIELNQEYQKLKVDLPAMKAKRDYLVGKIDDLEDKVKEQAKRINEMDVEEMVAKADFDRMLEVFSGIDKQIGWAPTTVISERQDLYLIEEAIPNPKKVYPQRTLFAGLVGMIAFLVIFLYYLMADLYGLVTLGHATEGQKEENGNSAA